jgi:DNA topoisomerase-1
MSGNTSHAQSIKSARTAGLRYVSDQGPGIRRVRSGQGFRYVLASGKRLRASHQLKRIHKLAIPPAWNDVWICPTANGHLQATGRDARGRKQYRYHAGWRLTRDQTKFGRMIEFGKALPGIRKRLSRDLRLSGLPEDKVIASIVSLLEKTLIRVGNEEYARQNHSFGLTTLRNRHVDVSRSTVRFEFRGKSGIKRVIKINDRRLAAIVKRCRDLPGQELFQYVDDQGVRHGIGSAEVNEYLRNITHFDFTAKDFRTWAGTVMALRALRDSPRPTSKRQCKHNIQCALEKVAKQLGNTVAICRKCYVHPCVIEAYQSGSLSSSSPRQSGNGLPVSRTNLRREESMVIRFLEKQRQEPFSRACP